MMEENMQAETAVSASQPDNPSRRSWWWLIGLALILLPACSCGVLLVTVGSFNAFQGGTPGLGDAVAVIRVTGPILSSDETEGSRTTAISGAIKADLRQAANDSTVKAIVLRVDSPGGSVSGSAQIYEVVKEIEKPVIVSMAATAASGGYYISAPADYIIARPDTFTGSIGVILTVTDAEELLEEVGVEVIAITSGPNKDLGSYWSDLSDEELEILQTLVDESYEDFVQAIVEGRDIREDKVRELADGRIYSGRQALQLGLVDELGNLQAAIDKAAELGEIDGEPRIIEYERLPTIRQLLGGVNARLEKSQTEAAIDAVMDTTLPRIEYRYIGGAD